MSTAGSIGSDSAVTAKVLFDYVAEQEDELSINIGDIITNVIQEEGGWWKGEAHGKSGMFPENFVAVVKTQPSSKVEVKTQSTSKAEVKFDYDPEQEDELALVKGTTIEVIETTDEGWWKGRYNGKEGMFPSNFVEIQEVSKSSEPTPKPLPIPDAEHGKQPEHNTETPHPQAIQPKMRSIFGGIKPEDLSRNKLKKVTKHGSFEQKSDELTPGEALNQTEALKPTQMVTPLNLDSEKEKNKKTPMMPASSGLAVNKKKLQKVRALFDYDPEQDDELKLNIGDIITVINSELTFDGWMKGEVNGNSGVFPDNFVELLPTEHSEQSGVEPVKAEPVKAEPVKAEPVPKPQGVPMLPPGKTLQNELTKKLAQKPTVSNNPPAFPLKKGNRVPPPLPGAKPSLLPGTKPKPQITHNKPPIKPPAPMAKIENKPATVDAKPQNQPSLLKNDTRHALPKTEPPKSPAVNTSQPIVPKNEINPPILPKNEAKVSIYPSLDELKPGAHQIKMANKDLEPVAIPKCPSTSSIEKSPLHSQSKIRRSLVLNDAEKESFLKQSISAPNINAEIKKEEDLGTGSDHQQLIGTPSFKLNDVKPTDPLKHMQRVKPPSKSPPSKYNKDKPHFEVPPTVVDNTKEVNELKSQVTELQTKMVDMEKQFKKLLTQVMDDLSNERKLRLNQQVELDSLNKKLNVFLD